MKQRIFFLGLFVSLLVACGGRQSVMTGEQVQVTETNVQKADALVARANTLWNERGDRAKALEAIATWNQAAESNPSRADIHRDLAYAYYFMNNVHVRWDEDDEAEKVNYQKGVDAAERALGLANPAFAKTIMAGEDTDAAWKKALAAATKEDVKALYWYATNLAKWGLKNGIASLLKYKDRVFGIMQRCKELDPSFWYNGPARYMGAYWLKIPFGKDPKKSFSNFTESIKGSPHYLDGKLLFAEIYAVRTDDEDLFKKTLQEILDTSDDVDEKLVPENKNAKRIAQQMLDDIEEFF